MKIPSAYRKEFTVGISAVAVGILGLFLSLNLIFKQTNYRSQASTSYLPKEIKVSNLSENSVTVSWLTDQPTSASLIYSLNANLANSQTVIDQRGINTISQFHYLNLTSLSPGKNYYFRLISGGQTYDNQGKAYVITTRQHQSVTPAPPFSLRGNLNQEGLIYFSFNDSYPVSVLTDQTGRFLLDLANVAKKDLSGAYPAQKGEIGYLLVQTATDSWQQKVVIGEETEVVVQKPAVVNLEERTTALQTNLPQPTQPVKLSFLNKITNLFKNLLRVIGINK